VNAASITTAEFGRARELVYDLTGISLSDAKRGLVVGRLAKRLAHFAFDTYDQYLDLISAPSSEEELQTFINLLTTNETSFFREPRHFEFLRSDILPELARAPEVRIWSAACSTGEEPYTLAMVLAEARPQSRWEVLGTDVSTRALATARRGHYTEDRAVTIPQGVLHKYCLKGVRKQSGTFLIDQSLRARVRFQQLNLIEPLPDIGQFDVIFLRNVMIYFDVPTKAKVVSRLLTRLKPGGYFMPGHCETLQGMAEGLKLVRTAIYRKPA
jgi:chemotaxis protein methyltransferase CheR